MRRFHIAVAGGLVAAIGAAGAFAASDVKTGPSSSQSAYVVPVGSMPAGLSTRSILTVGDTPEGSSYPMVGIPDGLGAYDNGDGTFTLLMNHELGSSAGGVHAHGAKGAFVSRWVIEKSSLKVLSGTDLIQNVYTAKSDGTYNGSSAVAFSRFCSADLAPLSAFWNAASGKGYNGRIFLNGEESGAQARAFAHFATGPETGNSYELPYLGRFSWENAVAHPDAGDRTIVVGQDDTAATTSAPNNGQVYVYAGDKSAAGSPVARAGLSGGSLHGIQVRVGGAPLATEFSKSDWAVGDTFPFATVDVSGDRKDGAGAWSGATLQTQSVAKGVTGFERPEDGAWDPSNPTDYYFVTTSSIVFNTTIDPGRSGHTRLWRLRFTDPTHPEQGGTIRLLVDGPRSLTADTFTDGPKMFDNIAVSKSGQIVLQEDPGNQAYLAKLWMYDIASGKLVQIGQHDPARFVVGAEGFLTKDEESSGVIDVSDILGEGWYLFDDQAHYANGSTLVEGGQLLALHLPPGKLGKLFG